MIRLIPYTFQCAAGETFADAAALIFGREMYAPELMAANPEYAGRIRFDGTEQLYIPDIVLPDESDVPVRPVKAPWR